MIVNLILASLIFISYFLWEVGNLNAVINKCLKLVDEDIEKEFLDEIRMRNGNLTVVCGRCDMSEAEEL